MFSDLIFEKELKGKTLVRIEQEDDDELVLKTSLGEIYRLNHHRTGRERVYIEDMCGDLSDLIGEPLLEAEEVTSYSKPEGAKADAIEYLCCQWTFYKLGTRKGSVVIRWFANYSEYVDFSKDD